MGAVNLEQVLDGVLTFFSETGTEGGLWAFQDSQHMQKNVPKGYCKKCGIYLRDSQPACLDGDHEELIGDAWSYDGLHILKNGDELTIYDPDDEEVWSGVINLQQYPVFTEHVNNFWLHADQIGVERDVWAEYFFERYSAKLVLKAD